MDASARSSETRSRPYSCSRDTIVLAKPLRPARWRGRRACPTSARRRRSPIACACTRRISLARLVLGLHALPEPADEGVVLACDAFGSSHSAARRDPQQSEGLDSAIRQLAEQEQRHSSVGPQRCAMRFTSRPSGFRTVPSERRPLPHGACRLPLGLLIFTARSTPVQLAISNRLSRSAGYKHLECTGLQLLVCVAVPY